MSSAHTSVLRLTQVFVLIDYMAVGAMRTVLPYYAKQLGAGEGSVVGLLETVYGIGQVVGALMLGYLSDSRGRKFVLILSFLGAAIGYATASLAVYKSSVILLLLSRLPVGLAKQTVTASRAIISDLTKADESRSQALALMFAGCSLGYAVGPYLGGLLAERAGSASPLPALASAAIFLGLIPAAAVLLPETLAMQPPRLPDKTPAKRATRATSKSPSRRSSASPARRRKGGGGGGQKAEEPAAAAPPPVAVVAAKGTGGGGGRGAAAGRERHLQMVLLLAVTLPEGALVMFSSTSLALLAQSIGWPPSRLGLYNSCWGVASGSLSLTLWPFLLKSRRLSDLGAMRLGVGSLGAACALIALSGSATMLWLTLPLGTVAVGMVRTAPASLLTKSSAAAERGRVLGKLDAAGSFCRIALPTLCGLLCDHVGLWAAFAAQAALCAGGLVVLEHWSRTRSGVGSVGR